MTDLASLLEEMTDLKNLSYYPQIAYTSRQASSYDRRSISPDRPGWFANGDWGHFLDVIDRDGEIEAVMMEAPGPGAIVRIWSANPQGRLRIYIDDLESPLIETDFRALMDGSGPVPYPFAAVCASGCNLYFPFPYAKQCKVTVVGSKEEVQDLYYHVNFRTYRGDVEVKSMTASDFEQISTSPDVAKAIAKLMPSPKDEDEGNRSAARGSGAVAQEPWAAAHERTVASRAPDADGNWIQRDIVLLPGERYTFVDLEGPGAIQEIRLHVAADQMPQALRQTVLQFGFDETPVPQVDAPVGDFFGCGPGLVPLSTLPLEVRPDGAMISRFWMPFERRAIGMVWNRGHQRIKVQVQVRQGEYEWNERSMHFRARWRVKHDVVAASAREKPWPESDVSAYDWPYIIAHGRGVYVGSMLAIWNPTPYTTLSGGWWGEGDEKIYVDGESFPSTFGTGSEDYFGYAWSSPEVFSHPLIAQPRCDGPGNRGLTVNGRWHMLDAIPFESSIEFYMELLHHARTPGVSYARMSYLYARPGMRDDHVQITDSDLQLPEEIPWQVALAPRREGRHTVVEAEEADWSAQGDVVSALRYSNGAARVFDVAVGDSIDTVVQFDLEGTAEVYLGLNAGEDAGLVAITLESVDANDRIASTEVDLRRQLPCALEVSLTHDPIAIKAGPYRVRLTLVEGNGGRMRTRIGIDYVRWVIKPPAAATH